MAKLMKGVTCIEKNGVAYYYARVDGQRVYCGKGDKGRKMAEAARSKYVAKRYESKEIRAGLKVKKTTLRTFKQLANWYMQLPSTQAKTSYYGKVSRVAHLMAFFGNRPLDQCEGDEQEKYRQHRKGEGAGPGTINLEIAQLSTMFHSARKKKLISADTMPGEFVKEAYSNPRPTIKDNDYEKLLEKADPDFKDILICGYESAMRSSEICNLTVGQVKLDIQHISGTVVSYIDLGIFDTKNSTRRTVPVSDALKEVLVRRINGLEPDDYVFTDHGTRYNSKVVSRRMSSVCKAAEVLHGDKTVDAKGNRIGAVFHCLRHTRTTKWVEAGFSDEIIRRATGHKNLAAYRTYIKLDPHVVMRLVEDQKTKRHKNGIKTARTRIASGE